MSITIYAAIIPWVRVLAKSTNKKTARKAVFLLVCPHQDSASLEPVAYAP